MVYLLRGNLDLWCIFYGLAGAGFWMVYSSCFLRWWNLINLRRLISNLSLIRWFWISGQFLWYHSFSNSNKTPSTAPDRQNCNWSISILLRLLTFYLPFFQNLAFSITAKPSKMVLLAALEFGMFPRKFSRLDWFRLFSFFVFSRFNEYFGCSFPFGQISNLNIQNQI